MGFNLRYRMNMSEPKVLSMGLDVWIVKPDHSSEVDSELGLDIRYVHPDPFPGFNSVVS